MEGSTVISGSEIRLNLSQRKRTHYNYKIIFDQKPSLTTQKPCIIALLMFKKNKKQKEIKRLILEKRKEKINSSG